MKLSSAIFLLAVLAVTPVERMLAQSQTEIKIRLMSEALTARDRGDFSTARKKFEELQSIVPNEVSVRRLLADLDARVAAQEAARQAPSVATGSPPVISPESSGGAINGAPRTDSSPVAGPRDSVMPVVLDENPAGKPAGPPVPAQDPYAEVTARIATAAAALAQSENLRLERMGAYLEAQREVARLYARDGNYAAAVRALDGALGILQAPVKELRDERDRYARQDQAAKRGPRVHVRR